MHNYYSRTYSSKGTQYTTLTYKLMHACIHHTICIHSLLQFDLSEEMIGLVFLSGAFVYMLVSLFVGKLSDIAVKLLGKLGDWE